MQECFIPCLNSLKNSLLCFEAVKMFPEIIKYHWPSLDCNRKLESLIKTSWKITAAPNRQGLPYFVMSAFNRQRLLKFNSTINLEPMQLWKVKTNLFCGLSF